jgi:Nucleotidyl transferase of unknown function (DUF2204)
VPARRGPDRSIEDALAALSGALSEVGAPWMVIGGIAVIAHGVQRMTTDIDAVIQGDAVSIAKLIDVLRRHQIVARIDDAEAFAAANLVLLVRHRPTEVDLDLSFGWTVFEHEALVACERTRYGSVVAPMARVEELLVFKAMAARPRDIDDAVTLLTLYPRVDLTRVRRRLVALAELADAPELVLGLEQLVRAAAALPATGMSPAKKKSPRRAQAVQRPPRTRPAGARKKPRKPPRR